MPKCFFQTFHTSNKEWRWQLFVARLLAVPIWHREIHLLKLLPVYSLIKNKETIIKIIRHTLNTSPYALPDQSNANVNYFKFLQTVRMWKKWGGEYYIFSLSLLLKRPIYVYSTFPNSELTDLQLCQQFLTGNVQMRRHLIYCSNHIFRTVIQNSDATVIPILLYYRNCNHYLAIFWRTKPLTLLSTQNKTVAWGGTVTYRHHELNDTAISVTITKWVTKYRPS